MILAEEDLREAGVSEENLRRLARSLGARWANTLPAPKLPRAVARAMERLAQKPAGTIPTRIGGPRARSGALKMAV